VEVERGDAPDSRRAHLKSDGDFGDADELLYYRINTFFTVCALSDGNESLIERCRYGTELALSAIDVVARRSAKPRLV